MAYASQAIYHPSPQYLAASPPSAHSLDHGHGYHDHVQLPPSLPHQDPPVQRKRPKYTRSKTGCLTCRQKKIKCDESKPACVRCTHGARECTWPEGTTIGRRSSQQRSGSLDDRNSTADSSVSDESSPSPTHASPPPPLAPHRRIDANIDLLPPLVSRRNTDPHLQLAPVQVMQDNCDMRRQMPRPPFNQVPTSDPSMHVMHDMNAYSSHRYDGSYPREPVYAHHEHLQTRPMATGHGNMRGMGHQEYWNSSSLPPIEAHYQHHYPVMQERGMVGVPDHRYQ